MNAPGVAQEGPGVFDSKGPGAKKATRKSFRGFG